MHSGMIFTATTRVIPLIRDLAKEPTHPNGILLKVKSSSDLFTYGHNVKEAKTNTEALKTSPIKFADKIKENSGTFITTQPGTPAEVPASDHLSKNTPPQIQRIDSQSSSVYGSEPDSLSDVPSLPSPDSLIPDSTINCINKSESDLSDDMQKYDSLIDQCRKLSEDIDRNKRKCTQSRIR